MSLCSSSSGSRSARKCPRACQQPCQRQLKTAERGPRLPSRWRGNEFNMCGRQGCSLRCCGSRSPGPQRKASAPACLCRVCRERTSGEEAPAAPPPRPHTPFPVPIYPPPSLPSLSAESTWRQGAMSEHPDKTWALKNVQGPKNTCPCGDELPKGAGGGLGGRPTWTTEACHAGKGFNRGSVPTARPLSPRLPCCKFSSKGKASPEWPVRR